MAVPGPHGLNTACSTWAQPHTSTARVTCSAAHTVNATSRSNHLRGGGDQTTTGVSWTEV
jgi:hypothetical protein